jgi:hypothetical protein
VDRTDRRGTAPLARPGGSTGPWLRAGLAALCLASGLIGARPALAGESTIVSAGIQAGPLAVSVGQPRLAAGAIAADGLQEIAGDLGLARVVDARGSGGGWSLRVTAAVEAAPGAPALPSDALTILAVEVSPEAGSAPLNAIRYPLPVPLAGSAAPTHFFSAAPGTGMGTVAVRPEVRLRLPAAAPEGAYRAQVTIGVVAGP